MSDKEFPSCAYDVCAEFDCEETMALALIATRTELERTRKALEIIKKEMSKETMPDFAVISAALKTALEQKE